MSQLKTSSWNKPGLASWHGLETTAGSELGPTENNFTLVLLFCTSGPPKTREMFQISRRVSEYVPDFKKDFSFLLNKHASTHTDIILHMKVGKSVSIKSSIDE